MTTEEVITALAEIMQQDNQREGFYTTSEIAEMMGVSDATARKRIKAAMRKGVVEVKNFKKPNMRGYIADHTGYKILPA